MRVPVFGVALFGETQKKKRKQNGACVCVCVILCVCKKRNGLPEMAGLLLVSLQNHLKTVLPAKWALHGSRSLLDSHRFHKAKGASSSMLQVG